MWAPARRPTAWWNKTAARLPGSTAFWICNGCAGGTIFPCAFTLLLHFIRWWAKQPDVDVMRLDAQAFTESTLIEYVRAQREELPKLSPETINSRSAMLRRLFRFHFQVEMPHGPYRLQRVWWTPPGGRHRRGRSAGAADLRLKVPPRVIEPL